MVGRLKEGLYLWVWRKLNEAFNILAVDEKIRVKEKELVNWVPWFIVTEEETVSDTPNVDFHGARVCYLRDSSRVIFNRARAVYVSSVCDKTFS